MFRSILDDVIQKVHGALCCSLMGTDGIPIEEVRQPEAAPRNLDLVCAEYAALQKRIAKTNEGLDLGPFREMVVSMEPLTVLIGMVSEEYFLVLVKSDGTGLGRARYELRKAQLKLQGEIA